MAHIGQAYEVAFRRDWNLNLDQNRLGWGRYYTLWDEHVSTSPFGSAQPQPWMSGSPVEHTMTPFYTWTWPTFPFSGHDVSAVLQINKPPTSESDVYAEFNLYWGATHVMRMTIAGQHTWFRGSFPFFPGCQPDVVNWSPVGVNGPSLATITARLWRWSY